jgi:predicted glycosyltransferase
MGIGHLRRNLLIAEALVAGPSQADILLIAGAREASAFGLPPGVDCLTLPSLHKDEAGRYHSLRLKVPLDELIAFRARTIEAALGQFRPDVFIVDKVPRGAVEELTPALESLGADGLTRIVLGLRDVLDDPATVEWEWKSSASEEAIRDYYDAIWIYGDPAVYDPVFEYSFSPEVAAKVRFTGYPDQRKRTRFAEAGSGEPIQDLIAMPDRLFLCMVGGGQDGADLADAFSRADFPPGTIGVLVTGPFMPPEVGRRLDQRAATNPRLKVLKFVTDTDALLRRADRVVAMGGYNTVCEVLAFEKTALIVPRVCPRLEQLIRAEHMQDLGLLDVLRPDDLSPAALTAWLVRDRRPPVIRGRIDMNGLARLPGLLAEVMATPPSKLQRSIREYHHVVHVYQ